MKIASLRPTTWIEQVTRYCSGCYKILASHRWPWTGDTLHWTSPCGKTCSDLRLLGDNELRTQMLPAQPQSSQAAVAVKQEFKQTHTHTHMWALTASMTKAYKQMTWKLNRSHATLAATSWPVNLEVVEFQRRLASNLKYKDSYSVTRLTSKVKIELEQVTCYSVCFNPGDFEQAMCYFGALVWTTANGIKTVGQKRTPHTSAANNSLSAHSLYK